MVNDEKKMQFTQFVCNISVVLAIIVTKLKTILFDWQITNIEFFMTIYKVHPQNSWILSYL